MKNWSTILIVIVSYISLILGNYAKGSPINPSYFFEECSVISFVVFFSFLILPIFLAFSKVKKINKKYSTKKIYQIGIMSVFSGCITSFGISGSLIFATSLVVLNLD